MPRKPKAEFEITAVDKARSVIRGVGNSLSGLARTARFGAGALGTIVGGRGLAELAQFTDSYNQLSTRIRTATKDTGDFQSVQAQLLATAIGTGTALEDTVDTFQALARVREDIGATNAQMLTLTETVQQLGVIGGTSQEGLANGLRQFNQAIAAGVFRAEEFNSIVENTPELAARIAEGLGKTQGELRKMVLEGQLFADDVINVLLRQAPEIATEFEAIPSNLDRAFTSLEISIGSAFSQLDQKTGLTESLADAVEDLARAIKVASGNATDFDQLEAQQDLLNQQVASYEELLATLERGTEKWDRTNQRLEEYRIRADSNRRATEFLKESLGGLGEVEGPNIDAIGISDEALLDSKRRAAKHFEDLLKDEAKYLESQQDLRLQGSRRLWEMIAAEEEQLRADELAGHSVSRMPPLRRDSNARRSSSRHAWSRISGASTTSSPSSSASRAPASRRSRSRNASTSSAYSRHGLASTA